MEVKRIALSDAVLKFTGGSTMTFTGYASKFGGVDSYGDTIDPRAYDKTLKPRNRDRPVRMRWNHWGPIIGKWTDLSVDDKGLLVSGELTPGHSVAGDVYASMRHGAVDGLSIGYVPEKSEPIEGAGRLLKQIHLVEISVVEEPADLGATVDDVKDMLEAASSLKEIESFLRDAKGFSRSDACALVSRIRKIAHGERAAVDSQAAEIRAAFQQFRVVG